MTHAELVIMASAWLRKFHPVVITEMANGSFETPDALGIGGRVRGAAVKEKWGVQGSTLIECKTSRADFLVDAKKAFRILPELGLGKLRFFLTPPGLLTGSELPPAWGLLEARDGKIRVVAKAAPQPFSAEREVIVLVSALRRIGRDVPDGAGVSVDFYAYKTKNTATLGVAADEETFA